MKEISGDVTQSPLNIIKYLGFNLYRGVTGFFPWIDAIYFKPLQSQNKTDSPGRIYVDAFYRQMLPKLVRVKENISILDIGCGSGYARMFLEENGFSGSYTGVDIEKHKKFDTVTESTRSLKSNLVLKPIEDFTTKERFDLVLSTTSFEHIPDDKKAVEVAHTLKKDKAIEIHIFPAFWSLFTYLLHGYRQYNHKRIHDLFSGTRYQTFSFGGLPTLIFYFFYATIPERLIGSMKLRQLPIYPKLVSFFIALDSFLPICPSFYAVVVYPDAEVLNNIV